MATKIYTKIHLLTALKEAGLPHTYRSLLNYERQGIINRGGEMESIDNNRYYNEQEIEKIVEKIKTLKNKKERII